MTNPVALKFSKAVAGFGSVVKDNTNTLAEQILVYAQALAVSVYMNGQSMTDQQKAQLLASIVNTTLENMPELRYEFNIALNELQDT